MQKIGDLHTYLVKVLTPAKTVNGTGFFCLQEGFILTCHHVVKPWLKRSDKVLVVHQDNELEARLRSDLSAEAGDIAVLQLVSAEHDKWPFLPLDTRWRVELGDRLQSFGYPQGKKWFAESGIPITAEVGGLTHTEIEKVKVYPIAGLNLGNLDGGYSGAPLVNYDTQKVVGLIHAKYQQQQAFIVPLEPLFNRWADLKKFHDICRQIREHLAKEAETALQERLKETPFIPLALEQGKIPEKEGAEEKDKIGMHGRRWEPFDVRNLMQPSGKKVLSADVGSGKTTFLCSLAKGLIEKTTLVPLLVECTELEPCNSWEDLKSGLIKRYTRYFLQTDLDFFFQDRVFVFLCDGMDQIPSGDYTLLAKRIFEIADGRATIIASRPSAALGLEKRPEILFLGLKPFSPAEQRRYFGEQIYPEAERISAMSGQLAQVPMLAFMIRTLIEKGIASEVTTRTELYSRFLTHILAEHEPNQALFADRPGLTSKIRSALRLVSYRAIAQQRPQLQRVEASLYETIEHAVALEELPKFGLINLILGCGDQHLLFFTHQSFQEFLAAQYAEEHQVAYDQVLQELWNPKWAEVIRFLAGLKGESLIYQILTQGDNVIHSNLFLAARCTREASDSSTLIKSVAGHLLALTDHPALLEDAIDGLCQLRDPLLISPFLAASDFRKRRAAINALAQFAEELDSTTIEAIVALLKDEVPSVRFEATKALGRVGQRLDSTAIAALVSLLKDEELDVQLTAATVLGQFEQQLDSVAIVALLKDESSDVRRAAANLLAQVGQQLDSAAIAAIVALLKDESSDVRRAAAKVLRQVGQRLDSAAIAAIVALLKDESSDVRRAAAEVLGQVGQRLDSTAIAALVALMRDERSYVCEAAAKAA